MNKFSTISSRAIPLNLNDVDTDLIIPAQYLTGISRDGYAEGLFRRLRDVDPHFPLNLPDFRQAQILVASENFGCGSSREHAVWALTGWGIQVIIAKSFADIFAGNSAKNGLLLITLPATTVDRLRSIAESSGELFEINLHTQTVSVSGQTHPFEYDPFRKHCLLEGLDDLDYILSMRNQIEAFRRSSEKSHYFLTK